MAVNTVKTKNASKLDILRSLNAPFAVDQYSTLNEKYTSSVTAEAVLNTPPTSGGYPITQYLIIGNGGTSNVIGAGNNTLVNMLEHNVTDAVLFSMIPWIVVPVNNDISPTVQANYRLRVIITVNSVQYIAYYVKVLTGVSSIAVQEQIVTLSNGTVTSTVNYTPNPSSMTPVAVNLNNNTTNTADGSHFVTQAVISIPLSSSDIAGIVNACTIIYQNPQYAIISEIGVVSGFDTSVTTSLGVTSPITYTGIQAAQVNAFASTMYYLQSAPAGITLNYALSSSSPLPSS